MNIRYPVVSRVLPTLFVGFLFWSWGGFAGWRTLQMQGMPYPQFQAFEKAAGRKPMRQREWKGLTPAQKQSQSAQARVDLSRRMGDAVKDPAKIGKSDVAAAKAAWGADAAKMLSILQDSAQ